MKTNIINLLDFDRINTLLEGFNKTTGFVTAILDLEGNVLSKSGWRSMCTDFHRVNSQTAKRCNISDTVLANKMASGETYHFYKCLNGLVDVAVPLIVNGEHIANLFSGQFFFEEPDREFFIKQADYYRFDRKEYIDALEKVPVFSEEQVKPAMDFLLDMTAMIAEMTMQKMEQIQLKEAIEESEHTLKLFVEHSPASIAMFDNEMRYLVVSRRFMSDYNLGEQSVIGKCHYDVFPEISKQWKTIHKRGLAGETLSEERDSFVRSDGTTDWVRWEIRPWYEAEDKIGGIILFSEVITKQVKDKADLTESENYNRTLFEQSAIGLALTSVEGKLIDINSTFASIIGRTIAEAKELTYWDITPKKYELQEQKQLGLLNKTGRYGPYEKEYIHKDGHLVPVRLKGLFIERNGEKFIWSSVEDISEKKKAERSLLEAKEQLSQILDRISDGFGSLDREWHYTYVNEKLAQNVGKKREELLGKNIWEVFPEAVGTTVYKAYIRAMEEQVSIDLEHFYPHFGRWFQHRFYPSPDGLSVFSKDITERKLADEKIQESSALIRIAAEKARLGGWNVDLQKNRSYWSDEVAAIHGMPPGYSPLVEEGINFYAPEWHDKITSVFTECAVNGVPYDEEMEIITSAGKRVWVRTIGEAVRDESGKIFKVQGAFQDISERKIVEEKSREKDLQFRKLSANVPDLIFQFTRKPDGSYCVPVASKGIVNIFGCSPEDVTDSFEPIGKVIHPDDAARVIADIEYSAEHLTYFTCEFRVLIPGKPVQWIFSRSSPERLPDGSITWYGFNTNITQRKEFEDALRESEGKFRKIYEEGPFGMSLINSEYKFIIANRTFCDITGYSESELKNLTFRDITYEEDKDIGKTEIKKLIAGEIPVFKSEKRYVKKDGSIIWASITVAANFDKEGRFMYNLAIIEDVTRKKLAEENIKVLNERLQMLVDAIQELSVSTSMENIIDIVRKSARSLVKADGSTFVLRKGDFCYYADEDSITPLWKGQHFPLKKCISGWAMLNMQSVVIEDIYKDERIPVESYKSTFIQSLAIAPIKISNPLGAIGAYWASKHTPSDIEVKLLNSLADAAAKAVENVQLIDSLENKISERTSQLQAANRELETFTYSVSHDLKAPLRGIDGYSKLLNDLYGKQLNEEANHFIATIRSSALQMNQLIEDLLQYSRLERSHLQIKPVRIKSLISSILNIEEDEISGCNFSVKVNVPDINIFADPSGIQIVLRNIIDNAVKFTKKTANPEIIIKLEEADENWVISVKDNGIGFDMKYKERIFEIFQRLQRAEDFPGTGIGLAMVAKAMQRMNGKVRAESSPGKGSTFYLELPKSNQQWNQNS